MNSGATNLAHGKSQSRTFRNTGRIKASLLLFGLLLTSVFLSAGCMRDMPEPVTSGYSPLMSLTAKQQQQKNLAVAAKDQMFRALVDELMKALSVNGPAQAIHVCKTQAPRIAAIVGEQTGVLIGRTSFRLRNPANQPPEWAAHFVNEGVETGVEVALPGDILGVLIPIRLQNTCVMCHGLDDQIQPDVKAAIVSRYPDDAATGFSEGDLRGYFWVEVPANAGPN